MFRLILSYLLPNCGGMGRDVDWGVRSEEREHVIANDRADVSQSSFRHRTYGRLRNIRGENSPPVGIIFIAWMERPMRALMVSVREHIVRSLGLYRRGLY